MHILPFTVPGANMVFLQALSEEATIGKRGIAPSFLVILTKSCNW